MIRAIAAALLGMVIMTIPSRALTISNDYGGFVAQYMARYANLLRSGERVVIAGECHSACTLVLGIVPAQRVCATPRARFGFHRATEPNGRGRWVDSPAGSAELMAIYPPSVRAWLSRHGGLTRKMKYASGAALGIRRCR